MPPSCSSTAYLHIVAPLSRDGGRCWEYAAGPAAAGSCPAAAIPGAAAPSGTGFAEDVIPTGTARPAPAFASSYVSAASTAMSYAATAP